MACVIEIKEGGKTTIEWRDFAKEREMEKAIADNAKTMIFHCQEAVDKLEAKLRKARNRGDQKLCAKLRAKLEEAKEDLYDSKLLLAMYGD